ncbi:hypothetical protein D3C73_958720 [compost metagenome]
MVSPNLVPIREFCHVLALKPPIKLLPTSRADKAEGVILYLLVNQIYPVRFDLLNIILHCKHLPVVAPLTLVMVESLVTFTK